MGGGGAGSAAPSLQDAGRGFPRRVQSIQRPSLSLELREPPSQTWAWLPVKPGSRTDRNIDACQVRRVLMSQICFSLMVQGIVDSLLIQTGLLRVSPCPCLFCFERRFGKWLTREIPIWVWFKDQQVGAVSSGLGLGFGSERTKPLFTWQGKDTVTTARSQLPPTAG